MRLLNITFCCFQLYLIKKVMNQDLVNTTERRVCIFKDLFPLCILVAVFQSGKTNFTLGYTRTMSCVSMVTVNNSFFQEERKGS